MCQCRSRFCRLTMRGYTPETQGCDDIVLIFILNFLRKMPGKDHREGHIPPSGAGKEGTGGSGAFALVVGGAICKIMGDHGKIRGEREK